MPNHFVSDEQFDELVENDFEGEPVANTPTEEASESADTFAHISDIESILEEEIAAGGYGGASAAYVENSEVDLSDSEIEDADIPAPALEMNVPEVDVPSANIPSVEDAPLESNPSLPVEGSYPEQGESAPAYEPAPVVRSGEPVISLRNASVVYPRKDTPALNNVSVDVYPGEFVFVVGHSGSGKSTFLRLLTRELKATSGQVIVAGQDLTKLRNWKVPYLRRQIGTVYQDFKLLSDKTIYDNVAFALECIGKPRSVIKTQVPEVLRLVGLGEQMNAYPDELSGGEQQRVSVARAMVNRPPLLICDEPTGNLDPGISLGIMRLLELINRNGTTVVMATHDREMVDSMRKRVIALEAGEVVRDQERGGYGNYAI